jgi:hypothetical protein
VQHEPPSPVKMRSSCSKVRQSTQRPRAQPQCLVQRTNRNPAFHSRDSKGHVANGGADMQHQREWDWEIYMAFIASALRTLEEFAEKRHDGALQPEDCLVRRRLCNVAARAMMLKTSAHHCTALHSHRSNACACGTYAVPIQYCTAMCWDPKEDPPGQHSIPADQ